jgi:AmmeMemoRadiSam system protein B
MGTIRRPAVAGRFYPKDADSLRREVDDYLTRGGGDHMPRAAAAVMAPHAGYVYSGGIAGQLFARIEVPPRVIILCPNHTGVGSRVAIIRDGAVSIPGADIPVDSDLADELIGEIDDADDDRAAHQNEHAIEVELPFLLARQPDLRIVPIVLSSLGESAAIEVGHAIHRATSKLDEPVLVVASSDMSHFLPDDEARAVDHQALEPLLAFDPAGLYRTVSENHISMCGFIPATAMLAYARARSLDAPELIGYATSGDAFGDYSRVVGYAGVAVWDEHHS